MKSKLVIVGAAGRMGRNIVSLASKSDDFQIIGAVERKDHPDIGKDAGVVVGISNSEVRLTEDYPPGTDVVIDFSSPDSVQTTVKYCVENGAALVLGTTALSNTHREILESASREIAVIYGTNMSVGMNVLFSLVGRVAALLGDEYDIEIIEQHHRFKKDAPSGSALTVAQNICEATGREFPDSIVHGRCGKDALRKKRTIGVHAVRAGDITGIHSVIFSNIGEKVTLNHTAHSRICFASGALKAAKWLIGKKPGSYKMDEVLGLNS